MPRGETRRLRVDQWSMRRPSVLYSHLSVVTSRLSAVHPCTIRALSVFIPPPTVIYGAYPRSIRAHCVVYQLNIRARCYSGARPQYRVSPGFGEFPPRGHRGSARGVSRHRLYSAKAPQFWCDRAFSPVQITGNIPPLCRMRYSVSVRGVENYVRTYTPTGQASGSTLVAVAEW